MKKHIAILGGGIAGLGAAAELLRNGCAVTVLEAKERFGGRVHTLQPSAYRRLVSRNGGTPPLPGAVPIELGAEFLHGENKTVLNVIHAAGLSTHDVPDHNQLVENGRLRRVKLWDKVGEIIHRVDPKSPDQSFQKFLDREDIRGRDRRIALGFVTGFHAAQPDRISAHALLRGEVAAEKMAGDTQSRINEGYSALVRFLEQDVRGRGGTLSTGAFVKRVRWRQGHVELSIPGSSLRTFDAAVITLPLGVLKANTVKFDPPLAKKREAIRELQFGNAVKIVLVLREPWRPGFVFVHDFARKIPTWWTDPRGPVVTGWAGGPKADALLGLSPVELEALALKVLGKIFSERPSSLRRRLVAVHTYNWAGDPLIRGAYSYIPVNGLDLPKALAAPVARTLYFAGEATVMDAQTGTVFGAFESGLRAAREVLKGA